MQPTVEEIEETRREIKAWTGYVLNEDDPFLLLMISQKQQINELKSSLNNSNDDFINKINTATELLNTTIDQLVFLRKEIILDLLDQNKLQFNVINSQLIQENKAILSQMEKQNSFIKWLPWVIAWFAIELVFISFYIFNT
jgi:hypothetical protein